MTDMILRRHSTGTKLDIVDNAQKIRRAIATGAFVEFHCYNREEVDETKRLLTEEERKQVRFFWLKFPQKEEQHAAS